MRSLRGLTQGVNAQYLQSLVFAPCSPCTPWLTAFYWVAYGNGLASYIKEAIALTEQYWCPIKYARRILEAHSRYEHFVDFGDAETFRKEVEKIRCDFDV